MTTRAVDTRLQLLAAARDAFEERGYRATTVAEIVSRAKTARGTFYLYFRNKDEVFAEVLAENCEDLLARTSGKYAFATDRRAAVEQAVADYMEAFASRRGIWRAMLEAMGGPSGVEAQWLDLRSRFVDRMQINLRRSQARGQIREDVDLELTAEALTAMIEWLACVEFVMRDQPAAGERYERMIKAISALWILGSAPLV
jgi:AcrR family transcriptional regulator